MVENMKYCWPYTGTDDRILGNLMASKKKMAIFSKIERSGQSPFEII